MENAELVDAIWKETELTKKDREAFVKSFGENVSKEM